MNIIGYEFDRDVGIESRADNSGLAVMKSGLRVEKVGDVSRAAFNRFNRSFVIRRTVPD